MNVVLWDLDGTLLETPVKGVFEEALAVIYPEKTGGLPSLPPGLTDKGRVMAILQFHGLEEELCSPFLAELEAVTASRVGSHPPAVRQGYETIVRELMHQRVPQGILTGNTRSRAHTKLAASSLGTDWIEQELIFTGENDADRGDLARRARKSLGHRRIVIVGDTDEDARAARVAGACMCWAGESKSVLRKLVDLLNVPPAGWSGFAREGNVSRPYPSIVQIRDNFVS